MSMRESGSGRIFNDKGELVLSGVRYEIMLSSPDRADTTTLSGRSSVEGYSDLDGRILGSLDPSLDLNGQDIELELENGRRWACFVNGSRLVNRGGIK